MKVESKIASVFLLIWSIIVYQLWSFLLENYKIQIFYPGISLMILGLVFVIWNESKNNFKYFMEFFMLLALSNFLDETFFNPQKFELNEIVLAVALFIRYTYLVWNRKNEKH